MSSKVKYFESLDIFQSLDPAQMKDIEQSTRMVHHRAGHLFYMPDDPGEIMFILKQGRVQLYRMSQDGRRFILDTLAPGAFFGHMALLGQYLHHTYAEALDDVYICVWSRQDVEYIINKYPSVAVRFLENLSQRLRETEQQLTEITFLKVPARLARLLLTLMQQSETASITGYSHQHLADMLGTYRETVTQTLNEFKHDDLVALGRMRIDIIDTSGLIKLSELTDKKLAAYF